MVLQLPILIEQRVINEHFQPRMIFVLMHNSIPIGYKTLAATPLEESSNPWDGGAPLPIFNCSFKKQSHGNLVGSEVK